MTQKNIWNVSVKELMEKYQVTEQGLTTARAEELRLEKGENILQESRRKSIPDHCGSDLHVFRQYGEYHCDPAGTGDQRHPGYPAACKGSAFSG